MAVTVEELLRQAEQQLDADSSWSGNCSLLAIAQMLKATIDQAEANEARESRYEEQDALIGRLGNSLRVLAGDVHGTPTAVRLHMILEQEGL